VPVLNTKRRSAAGFGVDGHEPIATVAVPASVGNVGPGFDILGLAVDGLADTVTVELTAGEESVRAVTGRDAEMVPLDPSKNCASAAARALLARFGIDRNAVISIDRQLPISGGLGASAAASVGGAVAAAIAANVEACPEDLLEAAVAGESLVAGRHLDNVAPALFGGLTLVRSVDPPDVVEVPLAADWWLALATPELQINTRNARAVLPASLAQAEWVAQSAQAAALVVAFTVGDGALARRALVDHYAEVRRAPLIPGFGDAKAAALEAGALGCSISGAGPTLFALCESEERAGGTAAAMAAAFDPVAKTHVGRIAKAGARLL
jgi:homoserine kinase